MITATNLNYQAGNHPILSDITLTIPTGHTVGIIGPNGSGKTTLLSCLAGIHTPTSGQAFVDDIPLESLSRKQLAKHISIVTQHHPGDIPIVIRELIMLGRLPHQGNFGISTAEDHQLVTDAMNNLGISPLADKDITRCSGGEQQRAFLARGIVQQSPHLLLDEPTNHLDIRYQHDLLGHVRTLGSTTVIVMHDLNLAARYCDDLILLDGGTIRATGAPDDVLTPEIIEPVYGVSVERLSTKNGHHLVFHP